MNLHVDVERVLLANKAVRAELLAERTADGHWVGELAGSPLATAAAISALVVAHRPNTEATLRESAAGDGQLIEQIVQCDLSELLLESVHWLARHQNDDGGWGDCDRARSNVAATMMVQAAFRLTGIPAKYADLMVRADDYVEAQGGVAGLWRLYGKAKTFGAGVLANCALAGMVPWRQVPTLRFELLCMPERWQRHFQPPAPRYLSPVFLAVGGAKLDHDPPRNPLMRIVRRSLRTKCLDMLRQMQAANGGFLDNTPLTALVVMSAASMEPREHLLVERGVEYLLCAVRADSSWSVTRDLAIANTTAAVNHLVVDHPEPSVRPAHGGARSNHHEPTGAPSRLVASWEDPAQLSSGFVDTAAIEAVRHANNSRLVDADYDERILDERCLEWLLNGQHGQRNPVTGVPPGGWAWTNSPGALPNTVDTSRALLALVHWRRRFAQLHANRIERAARRGVAWLLNLQNDRGSWPTFYRRADTAPSEEGGADVTALALRAMFAWKSRLGNNESAISPTSSSAIPNTVVARINDSVQRGLRHLEGQQRPDGSFIPRWFGNENHPDAQNPVCGTSQVLGMCSELGLLESEMALQAVRWLVSAQHSGGGWGPPRAPLDYSASDKDGFRAWRGNEAMAKLASVEETALAVQALLPLAETNHTCARAVANGLTWLAAAVERDAHRQAAVVGFFPPQIWYHERLYPLVFAAGALSQAARQLEPQRHAAASVT